MANLTHDQIAALWIAEGGPKAEADVAASIALAESGGNPFALNNTAYPNLPQYRPPAKGNLPEYSTGLWQINIYANKGWSSPAIFDQHLNAQAAVAISNHGADFSPWSTYTSGAYKRYLTGKAPAAPAPAATAPTKTVDTSPSTPTSAPTGWNQVRSSLDLNYTEALRLTRKLNRSATALLK